MKSTRHLVHPDLLPMLAALPGAMRPEERVAAWRRRPAAAVADTPAVAVEEQCIAGPPGAPPVRLLVYRPKAAPRGLPVILHIHGGGYVIGSPEMDEAENRRLAQELACVIVSVDYRLAPETPFPGPLEDCYAALAWLYAAAGELAIDPACIVVKGESAGGGLAAALALLARDRGEFAIAFQCLVSPMLDDRVPADAHDHVGEFVWRREDNRHGWASYLGEERGGDGVSLHAAPARAAHLAGLPPAMITVGTLDLFLEEDVDYARRLIRAGVPVDLIVYAGAFHGFHVSRANGLGEAHYQDVCRALARALRPSAAAT